MSSTVQSNSGYMPDEYFSGGLSISGLTESGSDFQTMIAQLRKIEMIPTQRMLRWKSEWQQRQEAFGIVREALTNLRDVCAKMNTMDRFLVKKATSSKPTVATATAGSSAVGNSYRLDVNQVASTSIWSLEHQFESSASLVNNSPTANGTFAYEYNGKVRSMTVPPNTSLEQFKNMINNDASNPGIRASLVKSANGVTLQLKGMDQGKKNDLAILSTDGLNAFPPQSSYNAHTLSYATGVPSSEATKAGGDFLANTTTTEQSFTYTYKGVSRSVIIPAKATITQFKDAIDADIKKYKFGDPPASPPVDAHPEFDLSVNLDTSGDYCKLIFEGNTPGAAVVSPAGAGAFGNIGKPTTIVPKSPHTLTYTTGVKSADATNAAGSFLANTSTADQTFTYTYNGITRNVTIPGKATIKQFETAINDDLAAFRADAGVSAADKAKLAGLTVSLDTSGEYCKLVFEGDVPGEAIVAPSGSGAFENLGVPATTVPVNGASPSETPIDPAGWHVQHSQNAKIKVDGWPTGDDTWLEVDSNTVSDVVEGVTFTLIGEGESTTISVTTDAEAITENVVSFIDAINEFRMVINELTKYDENKATVDLNYAETQFEMQKGSILTGNYGVQMISSRIKQATAGTPFGFLAMSKEGDRMVGDLYTSLSQMGIKTKAAGSGGDGFGLLELNTDPNLPMLEDVLKKNPDAVAEFFSAVNKGVSDSSHFSFASSMEKITRPGAYEVKYELDADGKVKDGTAFINGKPAKYYPETNQIGLTRVPPTSTNADMATATADGTRDFSVDVKVEQLAQRASSSLLTDMTSTSEKFATSNGHITYTLGEGPDQTTHTVAIIEGDGLGMVAARINYSSGSSGVRASVVKGDDGKLSLKIENTQDGKEAAKVGEPVITFDTAANAGTVSTSSKEAKDAIYKVANPYDSGVYTEYTSKTNTITDKVPGAIITLKGVDADYTDETKSGTTIVGEKHNDADGLYIQIDNMTPDQPYTGMVRIKQGKVNEILELLNGTANKPEEGILGSKGTLQVLVDNYTKIIDGIDKKIERETARLIKWERTTKLRFSRLEATIKQYESLQQSIESQISQLGSSSSKK